MAKIIVDKEMPAELSSMQIGDEFIISPTSLLNQLQRVNQGQHTVHVTSLQLNTLVNMVSDIMGQGKLKPSDKEDLPILVNSIQKSLSAVEDELTSVARIINKSYVSVIESSK